MSKTAGSLARTTQVHRFDSTEAAYDACQYDDAVQSGHILWIPSEHVVGIAGTWPVAVSTDRGELHTTTDPLLGGRVSAANIALAVAFARERGLSVQRVFAE